MQNRTTSSQRGRYDRVGIRQLARERADEQTQKGRDAEPWLDENRDFFREDYEELADARNYKTWNMKRNAGLRYLLLKVSRFLVDVSYDLTILAEGVSGNDVKLGKIKDR